MRLSFGALVYRATSWQRARARERGRALCFHCRAHGSAFMQQCASNVFDHCTLCAHTAKVSAATTTTATAGELGDWQHMKVALNGIKIHLGCRLGNSLGPIELPSSRAANQQTSQQPHRY